MPYDGEFAGYRPLQRLAQAEDVKQLLLRARVETGRNGATRPAPISLPVVAAALPEFVVAIDGSYAEVPVQNGYPGAMVGYCTVASVLLNLGEMGRLDEMRPIDPRTFRQLEEASTIDAALPGCNVITGTHGSARDSFREELYTVLRTRVIDEEDRVPLLETYETLLALKPQGRGQVCPYEGDGCSHRIELGSGFRSCGCSAKRAVFSTDALRIYERFRDAGTNGETFAEVMQVWERLLLVHLLRCLERRNLLDYVDRLAFIVDGPLAVFGHPAWLSAAIREELQRLNAVVRQRTGADLLIVGVEKTGTFVTHFDEIDQTRTPGEEYFPPRSYMLPTDRYIKERIIYSDSTKPYGEDTYFGRKFFYKTASGARIVGSIPFLTREQETLESDDPTSFPRFADTCAMLDTLVSSRYRNALSPLISAHAQAAIPLNLGAKVLQQLAKALIQQE